MVNSIHGEFESCEFIESIVKRLLESQWCRTWRSIWIHGKSQFTLGCSSIHWVATYLNGWLKISRTPHYLQPETVGPREKATGYAATVKFKCSATSGSQLVQWDSVIFINQKGCCNQNSVPFFNDNCTYDMGLIVTHIFLAQKEVARRFQTLYVYRIWVWVKIRYPKIMDG